MLTKCSLSRVSSTEPKKESTESSSLPPRPISFIRRSMSIEGANCANADWMKESRADLNWRFFRKHRPL